MRIPRLRRVDRCLQLSIHFSLASPNFEPELTIHRESETANPLEELSLSMLPASGARRDGSAMDGHLDRIFGAAEREPEHSAASSSASSSAAAAVARMPAREERMPRAKSCRSSDRRSDDEPLSTRRRRRVCRWRSAAARPTSPD